MTIKKSNIMSLSIELETQEQLKRVAKKRNISVSKLIRDIVEKNLSNDEDTDTVILKIPTHLKANADDLRKWLDSRVNAIVSKLVS